MRRELSVGIEGEFRHSKATSVRIAESYPGGDLGEQINAADASLGSSPGEIRVSAPGEVLIPIKLSRGHVLAFGPGEWRFHATPAITVDDACGVLGAGVFRTRLVLAGSASGDLVRSHGFEALTGTPDSTILSATSSAPQVKAFEGGVKYVSVRDLTLSGHPDQDPGTSTGLRLYGFWWTLSDVVVEHFSGDGIVSEWIASGTVDKHGSDLPESWVTRVKLNANGGNGWTVRGPHDTAVNGLVAANNRGWGVDVQHKEGVYSGGGLMLDNAHLYGNGLGGLRTERGANIVAFGLESEANAGPGLLLRSNDNVVTGLFYANKTHGVQIGDSLNYSGANLLNVQSHNNAMSQFAWERSAGFNHVSGVLFATGNQIPYTGRPTQADLMTVTAGERTTGDVEAWFPGGIRFNDAGEAFGVRGLHQE